MSVRSNLKQRAFHPRQVGWGFWGVGGEMIPKLFNDACSTVPEAWDEWTSNVQQQYLTAKRKGEILGKVNNKAIARNAPLMYCIDAYVQLGRVTEPFAVAYFENVRVAHRMPLGVFRNSVRMAYRIVNSMELIAFPNAKFTGQPCLLDLKEGWDTPIRNSKITIGQFLESLSPFLTAIKVSIFAVKAHVDTITLQNPSHPPPTVSPVNEAGGCPPPVPHAHQGKH